MKASLSRFAQRARPYALSIALACAVTAAAGVAWAQTRISPTGVGVSGSVIGDDVLYSIGGGRAVSMGGAGNMQSIGVGIGWNSNLICGDMSITTTLQNQLNGITNGFQQIMSNVIQSATSAVASLPALIIQRADPGLYNLLTNGVLHLRYGGVEILDTDRLRAWEFRGVSAKASEKSQHKLRTAALSRSNGVADYALAADTTGESTSASSAEPPGCGTRG